MDNGGKIGEKVGGKVCGKVVGKFPQFLKSGDFGENWGKVEGFCRGMWKDLQEIYTREKLNFTTVRRTEMRSFP